MATKEQITESATALTEAMGHSEVELVRLGEVRSEYRAQLASTQAALTREAELESARSMYPRHHRRSKQRNRCSPTTSNTCAK